MIQASIFVWGFDVCQDLRLDPASQFKVSCEICTHSWSCVLTTSASSEFLHTPKHHTWYLVYMTNKEKRTRTYICVCWYYYTVEASIARQQDTGHNRARFATLVMLFYFLQPYRNARASCIVRYLACYNIMHRNSTYRGFWPRHHQLRETTITTTQLAERTYILRCSYKSNSQLTADEFVLFGVRALRVYTRYVRISHLNKQNCCTNKYPRIYIPYVVGG